MIFQKILRKRHFRKMIAQLSGAKKLREKEDPYFVINTVSDLTEVPLGLEYHEFPKILVGLHAANTEIIMRQIFLLGHNKICAGIMQSIGKGKPVAIAIPLAWVNHLVANGVYCSSLLCQVKLYLLSFKRMAFSMAKFLYLAFQMNTPKYPGCPYVVFHGLQQNNLPGYDGGKKTRDLIRWYKGSIMRNPFVKKIWVQARVDSDYKPPDDLIVSQVLFPRFSSFTACLNYYSIILSAFVVSLIGMLRGRWWYGFILNESINLHYVKNLKREYLAEEYFFNNSSWFYKPMWTYEVENYKPLVSQIFYSTNNEKLVYHYYKENVYPGYRIMKWKRNIVWDQQQENDLKQYFPNSEYIKVGYVDITGISSIPFTSKGRKILSIFDVTPTRPLMYSSLGYAHSPYYSEELNIKFLQDIKEIFCNDNWLIFWKPKRNVGSEFISEIFKRKQLKIVDGNLIRVDPGISASFLIESSDAVISMPFSSPSLIAKFKHIPCMFYDASGCVRNKNSHGIPLFRSKVELKEWFKLLTKKGN